MDKGASHKISDKMWSSQGPKQTFITSARPSGDLLLIEGKKNCSKSLIPMEEQYSENGSGDIHVQPSLPKCFIQAGRQSHIF